MIDSIRLFTENFEILEKSYLTVVPGKVNAATGEVLNESVLWRTLSGKEIYGLKAYLNCSKWRITIKHGKALIDLSIPKAASLIYSGVASNAYPVSKNDFIKVLKTVEIELKSFGIIIDLEECGISRLDLFCNIQTDESTDKYLALLDKREISRMDKKSYDNGYIWGNTQHAICVYDKSNESDDDTVPENTMRLEYRLKNPVKIRKELGIEKSTVTELIQNWDELEISLEETLSQTVLNYEDGDEDSCSDLFSRDCINSFQRDHGSKWISKYIERVGLVLIYNILTTEKFCDYLTKSEASRQTVNHYRRKVNSIPIEHLRYASSTVARNRIQELRRKCLVKKGEE